MSGKQLIKEILRSNNYWTLNKTVVREFGIETAFLLTNLAEAESMMADENGWFYQTSDTLEELTTLSRYKQDKSIEELEEAGILIKEVRGIPAKRYFKLDYETLANKIAKNSQTGFQKTRKQEFKKLATNKESNNKESNKEITTTSDGAADFKRVSRFYQNNFGMLNPYTAEDLQYRIQEIGADLVIEAMKKALDNGKPYSYAKGIMDNWYKNNILTVEDVEAEETAYKNKRNNKSAIDDLWEV